ncbi:MAG: peptide ABC transporter substrate-binding protein [Anaerolineaceae bacterium]|jgi:oligopeptide transport system substrate-binding protein
MRSKWFVVVSLLVLASFILGACAKAPAAPSQTLRVNLGSYPDTIDPQKSSFVNEIAHLKLMYEGLTRLDAKLETVPGAAEKWEYNSDATELTFTLRANLKYSDGSLLNAKRFEYSILRNIDPNTAGEYASITDDIAGAAEWRGADLAKATPEELAALKAAVKVQALDSKGNPCTGYDQKDCNTLKIGLKQPAPYFHTVMSLWVTYPAKQELIEQGGESWYVDPKFQLGNGPMVLSTLEPTVQGLFTPNNYYWRGTAKVNIEFRYITDSAVSFNAYKNGEFDIVPLAAEDLATVTQDATLNPEKMVYPGSCTYAFMFHQLKEPFTDQKVREAFAYGLDRAGWVTDVLKGLGSPTLTWIPKGFPGYDAQENRWGYDPAKAQEALAASSYGSADKLPEITATFSDTPRNRTRNEWLAAKYKEVLGIDIKLNPVEATTYTALTKDINTAPQMYILGWCADYPDPQNWLSVYWKTGGFGQRIGYSNPDLDAKLNEADSTVDPTKRMTLYAEAQKMLTDTAPVAFFWNNVNSYMVKPYVKGIQTTPMDSGWPGDIDPLSITIEK